MPAIKVVFYQEKPHDSPVAGWLPTLNETNPSAFWQMPCCFFTGLHSLVMNFADPKPITCATAFMSDAFDRDRSTTASFTSFMVAPFQSSLTGLTKESTVPATDIKQAIARKAAFTANPAADPFKGEINDA